MRRKTKLGLALGAGGARGIAHVGVLKVLEQRRKKRDVGAADKAAIQLVEVQPYQLLVSDT